ncbi:Kinesin motor domain [Carpediemonas membranifera]|uniref:Kinesin motor domain n=1 Tax=Carpediemonas membranifera TaxID=201153 RepID=A0A8J6B1C8_9EUKA|nr:Kinesin motor domain [Carpediemonas membranifera]|eukprot:KAG9393558.1 Kinesin motor domain [Carpediemonas membranifera]
MPATDTQKNRNNIRVICRFRPQNGKEKKAGGADCVNYGEDDHSVAISGKGFGATMKMFTFDRVFNASSTQADVFETAAAPVVDEVFKGYNGTIFAYGQTSAGKTHTMQGPDLDDFHNRGLIPRIIDSVFTHLEEADASLEFSIKVSYVEIYMEKIRDLLDVSKANLPIHEDRTRGIFIGGVTEIHVGSPEEIVNVMKLGARNRIVASTNMNADSSRSHALFIVTLTQVHSESGSRKDSRLYLVDLAGSEKVGKTGAAGQTLEEAKMINKSLAALGNVINALTDRKTNHVPYRDSKLTRVLQESLGGNSLTTLIVCCSSSSFNAPETVSTLRFGERAKMIENKAKVNQERSVAEYKALLKAAHDEIARLKGKTGSSDSLPTENDEDLQAELEEVRQALENAREDLTVAKEELEAAKDRSALDSALDALNAVTGERDKLIDELEDALTQIEAFTMDRDDQLAEMEALRDEIAALRETAPPPTTVVCGTQTELRPADDSDSEYDSSDSDSSDSDSSDSAATDTTRSDTATTDAPNTDTTASMSPLRKTIAVIPGTDAAVQTEPWSDPRVAAAEAEATRLQSDLDTAQAELAGVTAELAEAKASHEADLARIEGEEAQRVKAEAATRNELEDARSQVTELQATVARLEAQQAAGELMETDEESEAESDSDDSEALQATIAQLEKANGALRSELADAQSSLTQARTTLESVRADRTRLEAEKHGLRWHLEKIKASYATRLSAVDAREKRATARLAEVQAELVQTRQASAAAAQVAEDATAALKAEERRLKGELATMGEDLRDRCDRVVRLEIQLCEAREQQESFLKGGGGSKALMRRVTFLERNLENISAVNTALTTQNSSLRYAAQVAERKLAARETRVERLETLGRESEARYRGLMKAKDDECARLRGVVDSMRKELEVHRAETAAGLSGGRERATSIGGHNIMRPIRGGSRFTARHFPQEISPPRVTTPGSTPAEMKALGQGPMHPVREDGPATPSAVPRVTSPLAAPSTPSPRAQTARTPSMTLDTMMAGDGEGDVTVAPVSARPAKSRKRSNLGNFFRQQTQGK